MFVHQKVAVTVNHHPALIFLDGSICSVMIVHGTKNSILHNALMRAMYLMNGVKRVPKRHVVSCSYSKHIFIFIIFSFFND